MSNSEVYLWHAVPSRMSGGGDRNLVSPEEAKRAGEFAFQKDRELYLCSRILLRMALSSLIDVPPEQWRFSAGPLGKPQIDSPSEGRSLQFNLSHTQGMIVCGVTQGNSVGVDVERLDRDVDIEGIAQRFHADEYRRIFALPAHKQREAFFTIWTLKEAYAKACGCGLSNGFGTSRFVLGSDGNLTEAEVDHADSEWSFFCPALSAEHRVAVAVAQAKARLVLREL